jgi:hypothetical protein
VGLIWHRANRNAAMSGSLSGNLRKSLVSRSQKKQPCFFVNKKNDRRLLRYNEQPTCFQNATLARLRPAGNRPAEATGGGVSRRASRAAPNPMIRAGHTSTGIS